VLAARRDGRPSCLHGSRRQGKRPTARQKNVKKSSTGPVARRVYDLTSQDTGPYVRRALDLGRRRCLGPFDGSDGKRCRLAAGATEPWARLWRDCRARARAAGLFGPMEWTTQGSDERWCSLIAAVYSAMSGLGAG
jgi:hypothetical protein